ncbi:LppX_LprAFG lipoprotein [Nocardia niigatensis]|uniref:LppX_LprAFG lipoprotein n=1 Tax=Nocardia niigatensis TaxID=209249 RepID=UPI0002F33841|nr:LppX_LprAFG lipoprotein [Nocardia niigatensis]
MNELMSHGKRASGRRVRNTVLPIVIAAAAAAALVSGCSSSSSSDSKATTSQAAPPSQLPDGAQIVAESSKTTQTLQSVHVVMDVKNLPTLPVESLKADVTNQPQGQGQAIGEAKVKVKPDADFTDTKFMVVDKTLYTGDGSKYSPVGPAEKVYDPGVLLDKDKGLAFAIGQVKDAKAVDREKIDGVDVVKVTGTIDAATFDPIVPQIGKDGGSFPITLYIKDVAPPSGSGTTLPSTAASPGTGPNLVRAVVTKDAGTVTVTLSDWAKPVHVTKPGS